jgi:hypothetical protein
MEILQVAQAFHIHFIELLLTGIDQLGVEVENRLCGGFLPRPEGK